MAVAPYHCCCIFFVKSESLGLAHTQREGITQKHENKEAEIFEG